VPARCGTSTDRSSLLVEEPPFAVDLYLQLQVVSLRWAAGRGSVATFGSLALLVAGAPVSSLSGGLSEACASAARPELGSRRSACCHCSSSSSRADAASVW